MQSRNQNIVNANVCYSLVLIYTRGEKRKKRREIKILNISVNTMKVIRLKSFSSSTGLTHTRDSSHWMSPQTLPVASWCPRGRTASSCVFWKKPWLSKQIVSIWLLFPALKLVHQNPLSSVHRPVRLSESCRQETLSLCLSSSVTLRWSRLEN